MVSHMIMGVCIPSRDSSPVTSSIFGTGGGLGRSFVVSSSSSSLSTLADRRLLVLCVCVRVYVRACGGGGECDTC